MAPGTIRPKLVVMYIFVAIGTTFILKTGKLLKILPFLNTHLVTFDTGNIGMFPFQLIICLCMVKFTGRLKFVFCMTVGAVIGKRVSVWVLMAANALGIQPEIGICLLLKPRISNKALLMAIGTFFSGMGAFQRETGFVMIEFLLIEMNDLKVKAMMIAMANGTGLANHCR